MSDATRMRIRHGRVMHLVEPAGSGWLRSRCRRPGLVGSAPRALGPRDDWSAERHWYPDCRHCQVTVK